MLAALDDPKRWVGAAASLLAELGFRVVGPEGTDRQAWHLLVALRDQPTLRHFDPEIVSYYAPAGLGASRVDFDRHVLDSGGAELARRALWGHVHVVDRIPVENRFLTFGGDLRIATADTGLVVVDVASFAPIVRWGGHSQGTDDLATAIGAFFGRLMVRVDFIPGAERRIDDLPPGVLYRAFLADGLRRAASPLRRMATERPALDAWMATAWQRARRDGAACDAAERLLRDLGLGGPIT